MASTVLGAVLVSGPCLATQLVYHPANPTFGGNPLNGSYLLSQAQAQGLGTKSGPAGPDLSGLENSLNNIGAGGGGGVVIVQPPGNGGNGGATSQQLLRTNSRNIP
jgi:curli production assembly/transport component CsgF